MPGIPREVAEHALRVVPSSKPAKQRLRRFDDEKRRAIPGGDGEKTLGEAEKAYILWRKRYIIIPGASAPPPADIRCGQKLTKQFFDNFLWA